MHDFQNKNSLEKFFEMKKTWFNYFAFKGLANYFLIFCAEIEISLLKMNFPQNKFQKSKPN